MEKGEAGMYTLERRGKTAIYYDSTENVKISVENKNVLGLIEIREPPELKYPEEYQTALRKPIGSKPLSDLGKDVEKVVIIVSDATRGVPTAKVLPFIVEELTASGVNEDQITVVIALGVHRPATRKEMLEIVGEKYFYKLKVINHEPYNPNELVYLGKTSQGTPIEVNKTVYNADLRIAIGKVEPHEFAGFSGGRKSVLPGIASERTVEVNHRPEMLLKKNIGPGMLEGNAISNDMAEGAQMLGIHFVVNFVLNSEGNAVGIYSGDIIESHSKAIEFMRSFIGVTLSEQPDIVVTTPGHPLNIDFYQSIKSIIALDRIMPENGVIVLYTLCRDGFNSDDMLAAYDGAADIDQVIHHLQNHYKIQMDHALLLCKILKKNKKVVACSPNIEANTFKKIFLEPANNPQEALNRAIKISQKSNPNILFFPQPQRTLPTLEN